MTRKICVITGTRAEYGLMRWVMQSIKDDPELTLQVIATATLAAYVADIGLGRYLFTGLKTRDYAEMLGGSILVILLALVLEGIFVLIQRFVVPRGVSGHLGTRKDLTLRTGGPGAVR